MASKKNLRQRASGGQIPVGWANLGAGKTRLLGEAALAANSRQIASAQILLESVSDTALVFGTNRLACSGASTSLKRMMLHEVGHALGFGDNASRYVLGAANQNLSAMDLAAAKQLY